MGLVMELRLTCFELNRKYKFKASKENSNPQANTEEMQNCGKWNLTTTQKADVSTQEGIPLRPKKTNKTNFTNSRNFQKDGNKALHFDQLTECSELINQ